jgi:hypothetical protein
MKFQDSEDSSSVPDPRTRVRIHLSKFVTSRLKKNSHPVMVTSRALPSHRTNYKSPWNRRGSSSETQFLQVLKMPPRILPNQCNSVIFLLQYAIFSIHPVRIHGSLSCDRFSWHSSQKFASESANIILRALFSVVALHFGRLCG